MKKITYLLIAMVFLTTSCKKEWFEVTKSSTLAPKEAFKGTKDARNAINGIFSRLQSENAYGADYLTYGDVKGDDVQTSLEGKRTLSMYIMQETAEANTGTFWSRPYGNIMGVNYLLSMKDEILTTSDADLEYKNYILANAYALRALSHFDLVRIYGKMPHNGNPSTDLGVPVVTTSLETTAKVARNTVAEVYTQVYSDLDAALALYPSGYSGTVDGWFNLEAINALYARVALYKEDWSKAYTKAKAVISTNKYSLVSTADDYKAMWSDPKCKGEAILTIINTAEDNPSREGIGNLWSPSGYGAVVLTNSFIADATAVVSDIRSSIFERNTTIKRDNGYLLKYPGLDGTTGVMTNNIHIIRYSEVILIAAEAAANGAGSDALTLLNLLQTKRGGTLSATATTADILAERRLELVGEGHRFFDLMRTGTTMTRTGTGHLTGVPMSILANDKRAIQPIPRYELDVNPNIVQNTGY